MISFKRYLEEKMFIPKKKDTLGIDRVNMPQIRAEDYPDFIAYLKKNNIHLIKRHVKANTLKAVQHDFNTNIILKTIETSSTLTKSKPIIASSDNYIVDGHHRWLGAHNTGGTVDILQADVKIQKLMSVVYKYPKLKKSASANDVEVK